MTLFLTTRTIRKQLSKIIKGYSFSESKNIFQRYKDYPCFAMSANLLVLLTDQLPIFFLANFFGTSYSGFFSFASSLLNIPLQLIGQSVASVFLLKASELARQNHEKLKEVTLALYTKLLYVGIIPFSILSAFGDTIFSIILGNKWEKSGEFAGYMCFYYVLRLVSLPISSIYRVLHQEKLFLIFQIGGFIIVGTTLYLSKFFGNDDNTVLAFSISSALFYLAISVFTLFILKIENIAFIRIISLGIVITSFYAFSFF